MHNKKKDQAIDSSNNLETISVNKFIETNKTTKKYYGL